MTWTKAILALGLGSTIVCGAAGASVAGIIAPHPTGVERDAATTIEVRYRRQGGDCVSARFAIRMPNTYFPRSRLPVAAFKVGLQASWRCIP